MDVLHYDLKYFHEKPNASALELRVGGSETVQKLVFLCFLGNNAVFPKMSREKNILHKILYKEGSHQFFIAIKFAKLFLEKRRCYQENCEKPIFEAFQNPPPPKKLHSSGCWTQLWLRSNFTVQHNVLDVRGHRRTSFCRHVRST